MADGARCSIRQPEWSRFRSIFRSSTLPSNIRAHLTSDLCILLSPIEGFDKKISICGHFVTTRRKAQFERVEIEIGACRFFENDGVVLSERFSCSSMRKRFFQLKTFYSDECFSRRIPFAPEAFEAAIRKGSSYNAARRYYVVDHLKTRGAFPVAASFCWSRN